MKRFILIAITIMCSYALNAQNRNAVWCFGDSAGIDFSNINNPQPIVTGLRSRGSCVSISDPAGQLLFCSNTRATLPGSHTALVYNKLNQVMQNGSNIVGVGWYYELVIIPNPADTNLFYLFSIGVTSAYGLYYSVIDMTLDSGRGAVTFKNIQLSSSPMNDGLTAIKHGNGRDWWLVFRDWDPNGVNNNNFYSYLITPGGVTNFNMQSIGPNSFSNTCALKFSKAGDKLATVDFAGTIELYDFDRCTGFISNPINIEIPSLPAPYYISCEFSSNGNVLYVTKAPNDNYLLQYDLTAPNIAASVITIWTTSIPQYAAGLLKRAPDNKIYLSCAYNNGTFPYPYPDSVYNMYNMNLSVINQPDSLGAACDFQPYSFYLGGKRTYWGLPNNPDYDLGRDSGSVCDTIQWTGINEQELTGKGQLYVSYINAWQKAFINAQHLKGKTYMITVTDMMGRMVYKSSSGSASTSLSMTHSGYFTMDLNCSSFSNGMYVVTLITDKEMISQKFIRD